MKRICIVLSVVLIYGLCSAEKPVYSEAGLRIENQNTALAYLSHNDKPLLAFGCHLEHMLFNDYDYEHWTDWAAEHGINHCRTRLFYSPTHSRARKVAYSPFKQFESGKVDLTQWDDTYWKRFHQICSCLQSKGIIIHLLILPQCTGGAWGNTGWVYHPDNNVNPETEFLRNDVTTEAFWQTLAKGKERLYETQIAILMKLIEESVHYDNIYYDLCHEPFGFTMSDKARQDALVFFEETTKRFHEKYKELRPEKMLVLGIDTDFIPAGPMRDWIYSHDRFNIMIQGNNSETYYTTPFQSVDLRARYKKPFCPQESCDFPGIQHIPGGGHPQNLTYYWPHHRHHLRKYVWRWVMAKSQLIDIYQKGMGDVARVLADRPDNDSLKIRMMNIKDRERYEPYGHNKFEKDALVLRKFWENLRDYPNLAIQGDIVKIHFKYIRRVLSSAQEAVIYISSEPGVEGHEFRPYNLRVQNLALNNGTYTFDIWKPSHPGGIIQSFQARVKGGTVPLSLDSFVDDIVVHVHE